MKKATTLLVPRPGTSGNGDKRLSLNQKEKPPLTFKLIIIPQ